MARYVVNRLLVSLATLWLLATLSFVLLHALPGNPFQTEQLLTPEMQQRLMSYYGLDRPLWEQYLNYMGNLLRGDLGYSIKYTNRSVNDIIAAAFPVSASLGLYSLAFAVPLGLFFGIVSARKRGRPLDYSLVVMAVLGMSVPSFLLAAMLQQWFGVRWSLLPVSQWGTPAHAVLPAVALGLPTVASVTRTMRASMLEVVSQDYIKTAQIKGLSDLEIVWRHQIRNALLPVVTGLGPLIAFMLMGSFVVEQIFAIPGLGRHFVMSVMSLDYTMALGLTVFLGAAVVVMNFLVDLAYAVVDPRIRITR